MAPRPVIIDCDPGIDDALALLLALASPGELQVQAVTTVAGNVALAMTTDNALRVCAVAGRGDVPVYAGCDRPLVRPPMTAAHVHGAAGLGAAVLPAPDRGPREAAAVDYLADALGRSDGTMALAATGPLTNIARLIARDPAVVAGMGEIVLMGGAAGRGNVTPTAEFNFHVDPHAAAMVMGCGAAITMITLDVTRQVVVTPERLAAIAAVGTPAAAAAAAMLADYHQGSPLHDPCVIAYLLRPGLFAGRPARVTVETEDAETLGQSRVDWEAAPQAANATVIETVDAPAFFALLIERLARL